MRSESNGARDLARQVSAGVRAFVVPRVPVTLGVVGVLGVWIGLARIMPPDVLPAPQVVISRAIQMTQEPYLSATLQGHVAISMARVLAGFLLGCTAGIMLGLLKQFVPATRGVLDSLLSLLLPLPPFTLIAVFIVWFGLGETPKIALIFFGVFARMAIYISAALQSLPPELYDAGRSLGASGLRMFLFIRVPTALPDLFIGMRILMAIAWTSVMGAELIAAKQGIGFAIWAAAGNLQTDIIFVGIFTISTLGCLSDVALYLMGEKLTGGWASRVREA